ncbi:hypothetical protein LINPERPRIM_LOCUS40665 [Linum perenne]
MIPYYNLVVEF